MASHEYSVNKEIPSFFAVIPATVRYSKEIEDGAKLLFAEITSLTNKEGYCWASNKYFAELYDVDISTIKRWITSLKNACFILLDTIKKGMCWERRIWVTEAFKNMSTKAQKRAFERLKNEPEIASPHININNKEEEEEEGPNQKKEKVLSDDDNEDIVLRTSNTETLVLSKSLFYTTLYQNRIEWSVNECKIAWEALKDYKNIIFDWIGFCKNAIKKSEQKKSRDTAKSSGQNNKESKCYQKKKTQSTNLSSETSENVTRKPTSPGSRTLWDIVKELESGLLNPKTS